MPMMPPARKMVPARIVASPAFDVHEPESREQESDDHRRKHLEEAFHQRCTTHQRQYSATAMFVSAAPQCGAVEAGDGDRGHEQQRQDGTLFAALLQRWHDTAGHQPKPQQQSDEQRDLPGATQIDVLVAAVSRNQNHSESGSICLMLSH